MKNSTLKASIVNEIFLLQKNYPSLTKDYLKGLKIKDCETDTLYLICCDILLFVSIIDETLINSLKQTKKNLWGNIK